MIRIGKNTLASVFVLLVSFLSAGKLCAQTVIWQMMPEDYTEINRFGHGMYKVVRHGKLGLIRPDGTTIVPVEYDAITSFYEHKALVIKDENGKERVAGCLRDDGKYISFPNRYYTLVGQCFYSDGLLSVSDENGMVGYIDEKGGAVLGFDGRYDKIKPFSEGYAAVFKKKKYSLIDKTGRKVAFIIGIGEVYGGTNIYDGIAYIWDTDGQFYKYDVASGKCRKASQPSDTQWDYLYCFSGVSGRTKKVPYVDLPQGAMGLSPISTNGKMGYAVNGKTILPCQFSAATAFEDNLAVVRLNDKCGLLRYVDSPSGFSLFVPQTQLLYSSGNSVTCSFSLSKPLAWNDKKLEVEAKDKSVGELAAVKQDANNYAFCLEPQTTEKKYDVFVHAEGLELWTGQISYTFKKRQEVALNISLEVNGSKADEHDMIPAIATVTNLGNESVTAVVEMSGSSTFVPVSKTVTIVAKGTAQVESYFLVKKTSTDQFVHVTTSKGGKASKVGLSFEGFY